MDWTEPFAIYRISADGKLEAVFLCSDMKKAKYWLTYIAQPGDVLCRTPAHPKHSKATKRPEYWCHKEQSGTSSIEEQRWKDFAKQKNCEIIFPEEQGAPAS